MNFQFIYMKKNCVEFELFGSKRKVQELVCNYECERCMMIKVPVFIVGKSLTMRV